GTVSAVKYISLTASSVAICAVLGHGLESFAQINAPAALGVALGDQHFRLCVAVICIILAIGVSRLPIVRVARRLFNGATACVNRKALEIVPDGRPRTPRPKAVALEPWHEPESIIRKVGRPVLLVRGNS